MRVFPYCVSGFPLTHFALGKGAEVCIIAPEMRWNISMKQPIQQRAKKVMAARGFGGLSEMVATLVREEFERRGMTLPDPGAATLSLREDAAAARVVAAAAEDAAEALRPPTPIAKAKYHISRRSKRP
jgi:hypothetical protein